MSYQYDNAEQQRRRFSNHEARRAQPPQHQYQAPQERPPSGGSTGSYPYPTNQPPAYGYPQQQQQPQRYQQQPPHVRAVPHVQAVPAPGTPPPPHRQQQHGGSNPIPYVFGQKGLPAYDTDPSDVELDVRSPQTHPQHHGGFDEKRTNSYPKQNDPTSTSSQYDAGYVDREIPQGTTLGQFVSSVKKNVVLKYRDPVSCCLEMFLPFLFVLGLVGIWAASATDSFPAATFVNDTVPYSDTNNLPNLFCQNTTLIASKPNSTYYPGFRNCTLGMARTPTIACVPQLGNELCFNVTMGYHVVESFINAAGYTNARAVPSLHEMLLLQLMARVVIPAKFANDAYLSGMSAIYRSGQLHLVDSGETGQVASLKNYLSSKSPLFNRMAAGDTFANEGAASAHVASVDQEGKVWGFLDLRTVSNDELDVSIRLNRSGVPWTNQVRDRFTSGGLGDARFVNYYASGFLTLQAVINEWYLTVVKNAPLPHAASSSSAAGMFGAIMPYIAWEQQSFLATAGTLAPLLIVLSFLYPVSQQVKRIVEEKEKRVCEAMLIMGLGSGSFYMSWLVTYQLLYFVTSLVCAVTFKISFTPKANFGVLFFLYYFFCLSCISLAGLIAGFFSKSRLAATLSPLIFFVIAIPFFAIGEDSSAGLQGLLSLLSPSAFSIGMTLLFQYEKGTGITGSDMGSTEDTINMGLVFFFLLFDTVLYFVLTLYLDNVLPSEWGTQEHPCFCILNFFRKKSDGQNPSDGRDPNGTFEPDPKGRPSVELKGLRKVFQRGHEKFVAVNDLTLNLYEGQIAVLLGHNGAGKTTAINLMTGMLEPTAGDCLVYGKSILTDMRAVRQEIGFCPQHNILWDDLTCREHLEYYGKLKGLSGKELETSVHDRLQDVDLLDKIDYKSSGLSGGQKRKLSVAIAFVGQSRVIFLDEPTAGMDVAARRHTWELIRRMSVGRTIVLTTHYMDEADLLGNSISIMSKGRLKCKGSSLFLKSRLGVGYTLTLNTTPQADHDAIHLVVSSAISMASIVSQGSGEASFRLPMAEVPRFPQLLSHIEDHSANLGIRSYGISVTTMEEVFMKIAEDEEEETITDSPQQPPAASSGGSNAPASAAVNVRATHAWAAHRPTGNSTLMAQFKALVTKRWQNIKRDRRTQCFQIIMPIVVLCFAMLLTLIKFPNSPSLYMDSSMYKIDSETTISGCSSYDVSNTSLWNGVEAFRYNTSSAEAFSNHLLSTYDTHPKWRATSYYCNNGTASPVSSGSLFFFNGTAIHGAPEALQGSYQYYARQNGYASNLRIASHPLPLSEREEGFVDSIMTLIVGIFIMIPFTFIPSTYVSWIVKERECKAKHLQTISGMNFVVYWFSNFVFDMTSFIITDFLAIIVFALFQRDEYVGGGAEFAGIFFLFFFYGLSGVSGAYLFSFAFDNHGSAQNVVMLANFVCGFLLVLLNYILTAIESTKNVGKALKFIFRFIPSYCLGEGIINMASRGLAASLGEPVGVFDMDVLGWNILYMALEFPIFYGLTMLLDHPARKMKSQQMFHQPDLVPDAIPNEDDDVREERRIAEQAERPDDLVRVRHLRKVYQTAKGEKVAVKNLSFGVKPGEVFGFLGTNGAGKTTSMSILCGEQLPTHGRGFIAGHDVVDDATAARRAVGYCPQFDALLDLLTAEEHLRLYAGLRGLNSADIDVVVDSLISRVGLDMHRETLSMNMSGGNKRKLSVAISLIGAPQVVFLDEPSAGMDPVARRGLWEVIEAVATKCSIVLTTHHLEEVEALADRVAIMVNGEMRCVGSLQQLKHKFGSGFEMSIRVQSQAYVHGLRRFMAERFPAAVESEARNQKFTYALSAQTKLSETFAIIEDMKQTLGITDYSVAQSSLEQVFLRIGADATSEE